jgi:O-antigen/teichoic acid export membrane protein
MVANICNYLFQFFMSRHLSLTDFGAMNSLLSLMVITSVTAVSILIVSTKYVSNFKANGELEKIRLFRKKVFVNLIRFDILILAFLLLMSPFVSAFLKISSYAPFMILCVILFFSFLLPLNFGILQGQQKFLRLGICGGLTGLFKLIFGIVLVVIGLRLDGAMMAVLFSYLSVFIISFHFLRDLSRSDPRSDDLGIGIRNILAYSRTVVLSSLGIMALSNVDLILVKHFFPAEQAGMYAAVAVLGRSIFYFPGVIVMAMFPIVSESYTLKKNPSHIVKKAFGITLLLAGSGLIVLMAVPDLMLSYLFGKPFSGGASFLRIFSLAMFFMALSNFLSNFLLAVERKRFIFVLLMGCSVEILLISFFHQSLITIPLILATVTILVCASLIYQALRVDFKEGLMKTGDVPGLTHLNQASL